MARVTIEDCISYYPNRFEMVLLATRRARQLVVGLDPIVEEDEMYKPAVQALREIAGGLMSWEVLENIDAIEKLRLQEEQENII
ncbi:MAG: DNA-directed RNA polymerase subunit omega [Mariprofundaceae bacterium]|nr:DNA-directed RNA polymerase subunit omega [Mariprofundaceae bacterium]